jgi:hypothetical protein
MHSDYPAADMRKLFEQASKEPTGAGLALIAISVLLVGLMLVFAPRAHAADLPAGFLKYGPVLKAEQERLWPPRCSPAWSNRNRVSRCARAVAGIPALS